MSTIWGIHNDQPSLDLIGEGFISVGWHELGDFSQLGDRDGIKAALIAEFPGAKVGAIPVWAGMIDRFRSDMAIDDLVISPNKADSTLNFGRIAGPYYYEPDSGEHPNRHKVEWIKTDVPRALFTSGARHEIGSSLTLFKVRNNAEEFLAFLQTGDTPPAKAEDDELAAVEAEQEPVAERVETYTRDFVIDALRTLDPYQFEEFTAGLLRAMGYEARVTKKSGDGGIDVIAHRDPFGLEPPIIKVQCKRTVSSTGGPKIQELIGSLAQGGNEAGLFVTLGAYTSDAQYLERTREDIRLINGRQLVDLVLDHFGKPRTGVAAPPAVAARVRNRS